jgi:hypothetical protein
MLLRLPQQITIMTTTWCNAHCDHCLAEAGPERKDRVTLEQMKSCIASVHSRYPLKVVVFTGGECSWLGEDLLSAIAYCDSLGIITRIVTNAYWATSEKNARKRLTELREAGLQEINFSVDDFHQAYISIDHIRNAWLASKGMGFLSVVIANTVGPQSKITPEFLRDVLGEDVPIVETGRRPARKLPPFSEDGTLYFISKARLSRIGRARRYLTDDDFILSEHSKLAGPCCDMLNNITITASNHLAACCGAEALGNSVIDLGNLSDTDPVDILLRADQNVIVNALALFGPVALLKFAKLVEPSIKFNDRYSSMCDLCEDVCRRPDVIEALRNNVAIIADKVIAAREKEECLAKSS